MTHLRPILFVLGVLIMILGLAMTGPLLVDLSFGHPDWSVFAWSGAGTVFFGLALYLSTRAASHTLNLRQAFLMTALLWFILPLFAAVPLMLSELSLTFTDAYFEAMSGITTTGSTVLTGLDVMQPGILLWRAILQWLGGLGVIVMTVAILPILGVGGMQLFRVEAFDTSGNIIPRAGELSLAILRLYVVLTLACAAMLIVAGLAPFDAIAHSMTTIATGGYSTKDASIGHFDSGAVESVVIAFMIVGSLPFVLFLQVVRGRPLALWRDEQVRGFLGILAGIVGLMALWLVTFKGFAAGDAVRYASFNVLSIMTGTGYTSTNYGTWGAFSITAFFFIMFIGGCAGSTSCGIKIFRFQVLFSTLKANIRRLTRPHGVFRPLFNGQPIDEPVIRSVMSFFFLFFISFLVLAILMAATGLDPVTALSGAGTAIANVGPGLGDIVGPAGNFKTIPDAAKWLMAFGMVLGRLELFTILLLFTPAFWKN